MSFVANDLRNEQMSMFDSTLNLTERERRFLEKSWAKVFAEKVFPAIDETPYAVLYSEKLSRPNTPVNVLVGAIFIQQLTGQSDDEFLESLLFDIRYQYALHTTSFDEQPLSDRSLGRFRERLAMYEIETGIDLIQNTEKEITDVMALVMGIDHHLKRMDSMMISANVKKMSRLELLYTCVSNLVKEMKRSNAEVPSEYMHYADVDDRNKVVYHNRSESADSKIVTILEDAKILMNLCDEEIEDSSAYKLLVRFLNEQTNIYPNGIRQLKDADDSSMDSSILQNPADPEATFRHKAGKNHIGYAANLVESSNENGDTLVTDFQFEANNYSDKKFINDAMERMNSQPEDESTVIVADGAYTADEALAKSKNIEIVNTNLTGKETPDINADFEFSEDGTQILKCPGGHEPISCSYNKKTGQCVASFDKEKCVNCPHFNECKPNLRVKVCKKTVSLKSKNRAQQQRKRSTKEFSDLTKFRNGVESLPSILRRKYHVDKIPARGMIRKKLFFGAKVTAMNIQKFCKFMQGSACRAQNAVIA